MRRRLLALAAAFLFACAAPAAAQSAKRAALVIGNAAYDHLPRLKDADQDAAAMAAALDRLGFKVTPAINANLGAMRSAVATFQREAAGADIVLLFYAGHALRYRGAVYLAPVDATLKDETSVEWDELQLKQALDALPPGRAAFVVLDGCGQNQLAPALQKFGADVAAGFAAPPERPDTLVALSTTAGDAACVTPARSSLLTRALLSEIELPGLQAGEVFERTRQTMSRRSGGRQDIAFSGTAPPGVIFALPDLPDPAFRRLGVDPSAADLRSFAARYPDHSLTAVAKALLAGRERRPEPAAGADSWRGLIGRDWRAERQSKALTSRLAALDGRWNREESDRQAELAAAEARRQAQERADREKAEQEEKVRLQRQQAELAAAEARRQAQERVDREKAEQEEKARLQRQQAELAAEARRQAQERADREKAEQEEKARLQRQQAELAAVEARRQAQERADREKAERDQRAQQAREDDERRRQAELDAEARRAAEEQRLAAIAARQSQPQQQDSALASASAGGQAIDEANRFTAEQRRLAQERIERDRRAHGQPQEFTEPLPSETGGQGSAAPGNLTISALPPADVKPPLPAPPKAGTPEFIKAAQQELKRLGCYSGVVQGRITAPVKSALDSAAKKIGRSFQADPLTEDGLRTLKEQRSGLCSVSACAPGQVRRGDICVTPRNAGRPDSETGRQATRQRQIARPVPRPAGGRAGCFNFGGRQYCQ